MTRFLFAPNLTDFYKTGHIHQFPKGTEYVYSNSTNRSDKHAKNLPDFDHKTVNFGLQGICQWLLIDLWNDTFFSKPKDIVVPKYQRMLEKALGVKSPDVSHIAALHDLGYLPVIIKALPEGARVNIKVPTYTIVNTLPEFYWVTNYLETQLQSEGWKPGTTATTAYEFRRLFEFWAEETGANKEFIKFQGHDFSMRGMSGVMDAAQSGAGHLLSFAGTDTIPSIDYLEAYYQGEETFIGGSVPATEHAVMCMGEQAKEIETYKRLITEVYPSGIVSIVSDTWDFWQVVTEFTKELKPLIMERDGKVVLRPDSGDPVDILCGNVKSFSKADTLEQAFSEVLRYNESFDEDSDDLPLDYFEYKGRYFASEFEEDVNKVQTQNIDEAEMLEDYNWFEIEPTPEMKGAVECLWEIFGGTTTSKGYKTLDSHIGLIYGDSINLDRAVQIFTRLAAKGFASNNVVLGIGSFTYQFVTRDTYGTAVKATYGIVNDVPREIAKKPKTDSGTKNSAVGLIRVEYQNGDYVMFDRQTPEQEKQGELKEVFRDSKMIFVDSVENIRNRLHGE